MKMQQIAVAVFNDRTTETARAAALAHFAVGASWDGAVSPTTAGNRLLRKAGPAQKPRARFIRATTK